MPDVSPAPMNFSGVREGRELRVHGSRIDVRDDEDADDHANFRPRPNRDAIHLLLHFAGRAPCGIPVPCGFAMDEGS